MSPEPEVTPAAPVPSATATASSHGERELGAIVADMWENAEKLARQEIELGLSELDRRVDKLKVGLITTTLSAAVLYAGVLTLLAAVVLGLAKVMAPWLAALIVGGVVTGAGATMNQLGRHKTGEGVRADEYTQRTARAMKEAIK